MFANKSTYKFFIIGLLLLVACAPSYLFKKDKIGYDVAIDNFEQIDTSCLIGKRILLDPGHGGFFRGVIGKNGLAEADVNLQVALELQKLLLEAGAKAYLTRITDIDFTTKTDSSLASDLAARISIADSLLPDIFLSLHHNSTSVLNRNRNEIQTYFPIGRTGADLDLARSIDKSLTKYLGIRSTGIHAGNFYVLRNSPVPAVLGEPSMLSNPKVEEMLNKQSAIDLEAKAYFLGIVDYFKLGSPQFKGPTKYSVQYGTSAKIASLFIDDTSSDQLDLTSLSLTLGDKRLDPYLSSDLKTVYYTPDKNLFPGNHTFQLSAKNVYSKATADFEINYEVYDTPASLQIVVTEIDNQLRKLVEWECIGISSLPCLTSDPILLDYKELESTSNASGSFFIDDSIFTFSATINGKQLPVEITHSSLPENYIFLESLPETAEVISKQSGIKFSKATSVDPALISWFEAPGFLPTTIDSTGRLNFTPSSTSLDQIVIVVDPNSYDDEKQNLVISNMIAGILRSMGASVHVLRDGIAEQLPEQKIISTNNLKADLFISIGSSNNTQIALKHYHGSSGGMLFANHFDNFASSIDDVLISGSYDYLLKHTPCPSVLLTFPSAETNISHTYDYSTAIAASVIGWASGDSTSIETLNLNKIPECDNSDLVIVDGYLPWQPGQKCLSPAPGNKHTLEIHKDDQILLIALDKNKSEPVILFNQNWK